LSTVHIFKLAETCHRIYNGTVTGLGAEIAYFNQKEGAAEATTENGGIQIRVSIFSF
jgi:nitrous oxide reductase accessory protein NosL